MTDSEFERIATSTPDITEENINKIADLFPDVVTEVEEADGDEIQRVIDFDALKAKLGDVAEGARERYQFTWPGKRAAKAEACIPADKTMRPVPGRSKDWGSTRNLYIEGDNLDALKILRETYAGKVKLIYIDPPYNTGHDFIYKDDFHKTVAEDRLENGDFDDEGGRLVTNLETNGRFHSDWCSMIYPRLLLARDLLTNDGVIFISIDDSEQANLRKICDEIFGIQNFVAQLIWERAYAPKNDAKYISNSHDYVLMYAKNINEFEIGRLPRTDKANSAYKNLDNDPRGLWRPDNLSVKTYSAANDYPITTPSGRVVEPPAGRCWSLSKKAFLERLHDNRIWYGKNGDAVPSLKRFLSELKHDGMAPQSIVRYSDFLPYKEVGHSQDGSRQLSELLGGGYFDGPKPIGLIDRLLQIGNVGENDIVLDFFSGSASTAHAVMKRNQDNGSHLRFILVQIPERTDEESTAYAAGYRDICELAEERMRRAGEKIKHEIEEENMQGSLEGETKDIPDIGFRVLRIDSPGYKDVRKTPESYTQGDLELDVDLMKDDRTPLDLLFECLPTFQIPYSGSIETLGGDAFDGYTVYDVNHGQLVACFDANIPERVMRGMAELDPKPSYAVVGEQSLPDSAFRTNFAELFRQSEDALQGHTQIRIL
ncbi:MAG: site-specific DNA-methyltransferase [Bifidobacterium choerinum]